MAAIHCQLAKKTRNSNNFDHFSKEFKKNKTKPAACCMLHAALHPMLHSICSARAAAAAAVAVYGHAHRIPGTGRKVAAIY